MSQEDPEQPQQKLQQKQTLKLKTTVLGFDEAQNQRRIVSAR